MKAPLLILSSIALVGAVLLVYLCASSGDAGSVHTPDEREPLTQDSQEGFRPAGESAQHGDQLQVLEPPGPSSTRKTPLESDPAQARTGLADLANLRNENLKQRRIQIEQEIQRRSVRIADELGLGTGAEQKIAQVYLDQQAKLEQIKEEYQKGLQTREARTKLRQRVDGMKAWRRGQFVALFGEDAAAAIEGFRDKAAIEAAKLKREDTE